MKFLSEKVLALFFLLGIVFIPLNTIQTDWQYQFSHFIFKAPVSFIQSFWLENPSEKVEFSSDSLALNILLFILFFVSILISTFIKKQKIIAFFKSIFVFYLIYILLKYGVDKLMGTQFYTPEPNILYSTFGNLDKDILFWSVTGLSKTYCFITGIVEIFTAVLLFYRRTRLVGLIFSVFIFTQILMINLSFDISVKTYSSFLLCMVLFLLLPYLKPLRNVLILEKKESLKIFHVLFVKNTFLNQWIQFSLLGVFMVLVCYPYWINNLNQKDFLHGAYEITESIYKNDTIPVTKFPYKRAFFHKDQFFILQKNDDQMLDFHYEIDSKNQQILLMDYHKNEFLIHYNFYENNLELYFVADSLKLKAKTLNWNKLPALQNNFHWTVDQVK